MPAVAVAMPAAASSRQARCPSVPPPARTWSPLAGLALLLVLLLGLPGVLRAEPGPGAQLFETHCAGCHLQGGNVIRRRKTLKLAALEREGIASPAAIAAIAAGGVGQMSGYAELLGEDGSEAVAAWVWQQAQAGWPRG